MNLLDILTSIIMLGTAYLLLFTTLCTKWIELMSLHHESLRRRLGCSVQARRFTKSTGIAKALALRKQKRVSDCLRERE